MNGTKKDYEQFSTSLSIKFLKLLRLQAFKAEIPLNEMLERYQQAYLRELEREKEAKKLKKEQEQAEKEKK